MIAERVRSRRAVRRSTLLSTVRTFDTTIALWSSPARGALSGGDWCETLPISDRLVALTIGDVSGHGESVARTKTVMRCSVLEAIAEHLVPSKVLAVANDVASSRCDGVVVTAVVAILNQDARTLTFANAGHPPPLLLTRDGFSFLQRSPADIPLGIFPHYSAADHMVLLPPDALMVLYTDGITEHRRDPIRGEVELVEAARYAHGRPDLNAACAVAQHVFARGRGDDDAAAIGLRTTPVRFG